MRTRASLVGRVAELERVLGGVLRAPTAGLAAAIVAGQAGIGKSRLLLEAGRRLEASGWRVLPVRADRLERRVPYAALTAALRSMVTDNVFTEDLRRDALDALEPPVPAAEPVEEPYPGSAFGAACASVSRLFTALAAAGPLAIVVDDLSDLDDECLALLAVVLRRLSPAPIGLIVALRPQRTDGSAAAGELLERLGEDAELTRVELRPLSAADLAEVVTPALGGPPDPALAAEVHRRAGGNPFFAAEVARSLADSELVALDGGVARLRMAPRTIRLTRRDAVLRRVVPLDPPARAVARALAVLRGFDLGRISVVAEVVALSEAVVAAAFDDLVLAQVVIRVDERRYRFSHDLVAEALYDEIGPAERRRLHGLVAGRLRADRARGEPVDGLELARHVAESAVPGEDWAVEVLADAARGVLTRSPESAAGLCERAVSLLGPDDPRRGPLLALRCRALARASLPAKAVATGFEAMALLGAGEERRRTAIAVLSGLFLLERVGEGLAVADAEIAAGDASATLHAQRALMLVFAGRVEEARRAELAAAAIEPGTPAEEVVVCGQLAMVTSMLARHTETVAYADRALRASGDSVTLRQQALAVGASTGVLAGLVPDAADRLRQADALAERAGGASLFPGELGLTRVVLDWLGGRWDTALDGVRLVGAELAARQQATLGAALSAVELEMRTWRGELARAAKLAARPVPSMPNMRDLQLWALAGYRAASESPAVAGALLRSALTDPRTAPYGPLLLSRLIETDPREEAEDLAKTLVEVAGPLASPWSGTTLHRVLGVLRGDRDALAEAIREAEAGGLAFERARAQLALGELAADETDALTEAYQLFDRLGVHRLSRQAGRRLQALGAKVPRRQRRAAGLLSESEDRVARLVQQGMRNREIAAALHYSPRSIEVYLSRVYAKLRVSSRLELARRLDAIDGA